MPVAQAGLPLSSFSLIGSGSPPPPQNWHGASTVFSVLHCFSFDLGVVFTLQKRLILKNTSLPMNENQRVYMKRYGIRIFYLQRSSPLAPELRISGPRVRSGFHHCLRQESRHFLRLVPRCPSLCHHHTQIQL